MHANSSNKRKTTKIAFCLRSGQAYDDRNTHTHKHTVKVRNSVSVAIRRQHINKLRPPVLGPRDIREKHYAVADLLWSKLFSIVPGVTARTAATLESHRPGRGKEMLRNMIRSRGCRGLATHARNVLAYKEWHETRWPSLPWLPTPATPDAMAVYAAVLVDFVQELMDADAAPSVPRSRITSLRVAMEYCQPDLPLPLEAPTVTKLVQAYHRDAKHVKRRTRLYTVAEIQLIEKAAVSLLDALDRLIMVTELRKLYGRLRQDDASWGKASEWSLAGPLVSPVSGQQEDPTNQGDKDRPKQVLWYGVATKTKSTEMRAHRIRETVPWVVPTRGISTTPVQWYRQVLADMKTLGMDLDHEYLLPSPCAVRAGRVPPGAAEYTEWIPQLRRTLVKAGFTPEQAATVGGHTAKRTMLTWLNASGLVANERDQQVAGYHRSSGPNEVARRYTLHEQAGPARAIIEMCEAIAQSLYHPDRPVGTEWDTTSIVISKNWDTARVPAPDEAENSDQDEDPYQEISEPAPDSAQDSDEEKNLDVLDTTNVAQRAKAWPEGQGVIYNPGAQPKRALAPRYHIAVDIHKVPDHIVGCKDFTRRTSITSGTQKLHVLCDGRIRSPTHALSSRTPIMLGYALCRVCRSRRYRWQIQQAQSKGNDTRKRKTAP